VINKAILRAAQILDYFADAKQPAGISEVSRALGIPKTCTSDCLHTLAATGLLRIDDPQHMTFALGPEGARLGYAAMREFDVVRLSRTELQSICRGCGQSALLAVPSGDRIVIADKAEPSCPVRLATRVGEAFEMHLTAAGKAILAAMTDEEVAELVGPACYNTHTSTSISCYPYLIRELAAIREQGYACENFEENSSIYSIAAPIYDCCNRACAAIFVSILKSELPSCDTNAIARALIRSAMKISGMLNSTIETIYEKGE